MNPIQLAGTVLLILALVSEASAGNSPEEVSKNKFSLNIVTQFRLKPTEAEHLKNKTVRFYFTVDESGKVKQVVAVESDPGLKHLLEEHFRKINFYGFPGYTGGKVDLKFITL